MHGPAPVLFGIAKPVYFLNRPVAARVALNMSMMAVVDAPAQRKRDEPGTS